MLHLLHSALGKISHRKRRAKLRKELDIGNGTRISLSNIDGMFPHLVHIGKNCIFAPHSMVLTHDAGYFLFTGEYRVAPVFIGNNCFVGYGVVIMPGVKIGNNVVIGTNSVVTKDIASDSVVAGVPAKVLATLPEYLRNRRKEQMFAAPYINKLPSQINSKDISNFRKYVYPQIENRQL